MLATNRSVFSRWPRRIARTSADAARPADLGFTLVELLVVIAIISVLTAVLLLPARENARRSACANNQKQLSLALLEYENGSQRFPGYVNAMGPGGKKKASWLVAILPYLEKKDIAKTWAESSRDYDPAHNAMIKTCVCPSGGPEPGVSSPMSYVVNVGYVSEHEPAISHWANDQNPANGVFQFRGVTSGFQRVNVSLSYINVHDGTSNTLLLSENLNVQTWTPRPPAKANDPCPFKNMISGEEKFFFGFAWNNGFECIPMSPLGINQKVQAALDFHTARPSSNHPGGVNAVYSDGHVVFLRDDLDYHVYIQLMTTWSEKSDDPYRVRVDDDMI